MKRNSRGGNRKEEPTSLPHLCPICHKPRGAKNLNLNEVTIFCEYPGLDKLIDKLIFLN